jgi:hypothetical protein
MTDIVDRLRKYGKEINSTGNFAFAEFGFTGQAGIGRLSRLTAASWGDSKKRQPLRIGFRWLRFGGNRSGSIGRLRRQMPFR